MRTALVALLVVTACLVATPAASACPDPDNPCDPTPYDPFPQCESHGGPFGFVKSLLSCLP